MNKIIPVFPNYAVTTVISSGSTQSAAIDLSHQVLVGIFLPSAFTGTTLTFQVAQSAGGTYGNLIDGAGSTVSKTVTTNGYLYLDPNIFAGIRFLKITSGSSEGADRTLTLALRDVN